VSCCCRLERFGGNGAERSCFELALGSCIVPDSRCRCLRRWSALRRDAEWEERGEWRCYQASRGCGLELLQGYDRKRKGEVIIIGIGV
jgi:hypothetical protein